MSESDVGIGINLKSLYEMPQIATLGNLDFTSIPELQFFFFMWAFGETKSI